MPEQLVVIGAATPTVIRIVDDINRAESSGKIRIVGVLDSAFSSSGGQDFFRHRDSWRP